MTSFYTEKASCFLLSGFGACNFIIHQELNVLNAFIFNKS